MRKPWKIHRPGFSLRSITGQGIITGSVFTIKRSISESMTVCFYSARAQDKTDVITDLVFSRLMYPAGLTEESRAAYEDYIREHALQTAEYLTDTEDIAALKEFAARSFWTAETLSGAVEYVATKGKREILTFLMNEKHRLFPEKKKNMNCEASERQQIKWQKEHCVR